MSKKHQIYLLKSLQRTFRLFKNEILYIFSFIVGQFLPAWIRIPKLDPDSLAQLNADQIQTGSKTLTAE